MDWNEHLDSMAGKDKDGKLNEYANMCPTHGHSMESRYCGIYNAVVVIGRLSKNAASRIVSP